MPSLRRLAAAAVLIAAAALPAAARAGRIPRPAHVVVVIEENRAFRQIFPADAAKPPAPYLAALAREGALFTDSRAIGHPSQPNYLALFSGSTHGVRDDRCPLALSGPNLAAALLARGLSFATYSESLPARGYGGCFAAGYLYARKHNPAANWSSLPASVNRPFTEFPADFARLPTISLVIPNQLNDMHSGHGLRQIIARGDAWLKQNIDRYVRWARSHDSLLVLTWDEDDFSSDNHIATLFVGPMVRPGKYGARIDHYSVLRTLAGMYGLPAPGSAAQAVLIDQIWKRAR